MNKKNGQFKRKPMSDETKLKIRNAQKGKPRPVQSVINMKGKKKSRPSYGFLGKHHTEDVKVKIGLASKNNKYTLGKKHSENCKHCINLKNTPPWNKGKKLHYPVWNKGKKLSDQHIRNLRGERLKTRGENHHMWKGGVASINEKIRKSIEYKLWRQTVFIRDNFTCVWCGYKSHKKIKGASDIQADHIKRFSEYPELRFAIDNGRTLCKECHLTTDTYGTKGWSKIKNI